MSRRTSDRPGPALLVLAVTSALTWAPGAALAVDTTVITDGTLGDLVSFTDLDVTIDADLGQESGGNLFHSFDRFDVGTGGSATFDVGVENVGPYQNVISRVTGGPSEIDGKITSNLNEENFFFLNPAGTVFGSGASLDLPGSFYVSTADALAFESGNDFLTGDGVTTNPTLNSAAPAAFGFLAAEPASIQFNGAQLAVNEGMTLSAVGGNVTVDGGSLTAPGGQVQLVSIAAPTPLDNPVPLDASLIDVGDYAETDGLGIVRLTKRAELNVNSLSGGQRGTGRIVIRAGKFFMEGGNLAAFSSNSNMNAGDGTAVDVAVTHDILISDFAGSPAEIRSSALGGATGDIRLAGNTVALTDGSKLLTENFHPEAPGADIDVDANQVTIAGGASVETQSQRNGDAGGISISGPAVEINAVPDDRAAKITLEGEATKVGTQSGSLSERRDGFGRGGTIELTTDWLVVKDSAVIQSVTITDSAGGGVIDIDATTLDVTNLGLITSQTVGDNRGGDVFITADQLEVADQGQITATAGTSDDTDVAGRGGDLTIDAGSVKVTGSDGLFPEQISTITFSKGQAPDGAGGKLAITADSVELHAGGQIRSITEGDSRAGNLSVIARESLLIKGAAVDGGPSGIFATSGSESGTEATGAAGDILVSAKIVDVDDGGEIGASTWGIGAAGNLQMIATEEVPLIERVSISGGPTGARSIVASQGQSGNGGNITVIADEIEVINGGEMSATTTGTGHSGNVELIARTVLVQGESQADDPQASGVYAQTVSGGTGDNRAGDAGSIDITATESLRVIDGGTIAVQTTGGGFAGDIVMRGNGTGSVEVTNRGLVSANVRGQIAEPSLENASDIRIVDADQVTIGSNGTIAAATNANAFGGTIDITATRVHLSGDAQITASSSGTGTGGPGLDAGPAGNISITLAEEISLDSGATLTAETSGTGAGGSIALSATDISLSGGSSVTTSSTSKGIDAGPAGNIRIAATHNLEITDGSSVTTTAVNAAGGNIELQAGDLVYVFESTVETDVQGSEAEEGENAGDINIPFVELVSPEEPLIELASLMPGAPDAPGMPITRVVPRFVVINGESVIRANANNTNAGSVTIEAENVIVSSDSVIEATSQTGVDGTVKITSPDADIVSQTAPLQANFIDASDRLLPPCVARTERTGSFVVQRRERIPPSPDSPLPASLVGSPAGTVDPGACSTLQGSS